MKISKKSTKEIVEFHQKKWADHVLMIGNAYRKKQDYKKITEQLVDSLYALDITTVLFKPTKASEVQFRSNKEEMISYFSGYNNFCSEDKGFAIEDWKNIRFENHEIVNLENIILSMGNYFFKKLDNSELKVEYTFGYVFSIQGELKINLHHSSLPYKKEK